MKPLIDRVQEFAFETARETFFRFTPDQAESIRRTLEANRQLKESMSEIEANVLYAIDNVLVNTIRYTIWKKDETNDIHTNDGSTDTSDRSDTTSEQYINHTFIS